MACFVVPAAEAALTTLIQKYLEKKERRENASEIEIRMPSKKPEVKKFSHKLKWLNNMLWGGSVLLAFEHLWHGEIVPYFPFLTAMGNQADRLEMLHEIATNGVTMALLITAVWAVMAVITNSHEKREAVTIE